MKNELISYETAVLAKEKGFCQEGIAYLCKGQDKGEIGASIDCKVYASAPTQSLLQRWLREQYAIHIELIPNEEDPKNLWNTIVYPLYCMKEPSNEGVYNTYEQALEKGLIEALKLIK